VFFRQLLNDETACASYLLGCKTHSQLAVVDPHVDLVDDYIALAEREGASIVAVFETHVHADHVSGLPELVARTGATAYLPAHAGGHDEIDQELRLCLRELAMGRERAGALLAIRREAEITAARLGRRLSIFDYVNAAPDAHAQARRAAQLHKLRAGSRTTPPATPNARDHR
jgi:ribonuclease BN (tRNA processing enzyme)